MPATVAINRFTGVAPGVGVNITGINTRVNAEDTHTIAGTTNPVPIDTVVTKYSFWAHTQLDVLGGLGGTLDNLRWFMSGVPDAGIEIRGEAASAYVQATGIVGDSGDILNTTNHPSLLGATVDLTTYTVSAPKSIAGSTTGTGPVGDFMVYQFGVLPSAAPGAATPVNMTWRYDET